MGGLRLYLRYVGVSIRSQLQYRASLIMQSVGAFLVTGVELLAIWALFSRFGHLRGWTLREAALCYGMISIAWALSDALGRGLELVGGMVKDGELDRLLLRPRGTVLQLLGHELTIRRAGRLAQGCLVLGYALSSPAIAWSAPKALLVPAAIVGAVCTFLGLLLLQATTALWTTETLEVWNAFTYGGITMGQYPLPIYRSWFRGLFLYVIPLGCVTYLPGVAILGRADPLGAPELARWLAPLAGVAFLGLALAAWRAGLRRYRSTGS